MIKLKITKFDKNEEYDKQLENYERTMKATYWNGNNNPARPYPDKVDSILEVEITAEQWEAIRKEVLTKF